MQTNPPPVVSNAQNAMMVTMNKCNLGKKNYIKEEAQGLWDTGSTIILIRPDIVSPEHYLPGHQVTIPLAGVQHFGVGCNGYKFSSRWVCVEIPRTTWGSGRGYGGPCGRNRPLSQRIEYRVLVLGFLPSGSWQHLKDHMREAGDVYYADVHNSGMGTVEFIRKDDMEYALRKLDDTKFRSHKDETSYIRVPAEKVGEECEELALF